MDPFQINAEYRRNELLEEAQADSLLRTARAGRANDPAATPQGLFDRLLGFARRLGRPRAATSPRKATV